MTFYKKQCTDNNDGWTRETEGDREIGYTKRIINLGIAAIDRQNVTIEFI